jgi:hypothetical protein
LVGIIPANPHKNSSSTKQALNVAEAKVVKLVIMSRIRMVCELCILIQKLSLKSQIESI